MDLTSAHDSEWALFLPAVSSFFITGIGKQMSDEQKFFNYFLNLHLSK
jgi:hypothetical protein